MYMPRFNAEVQEPTLKEEAPMNTTSTVTPISENPKQQQQRQTAKEIIAANVKSLIEQLEAGHSPRRPRKKRGGAGFGSPLLCRSEIGRQEDVPPSCTFPLSCLRP